ncbi:predicted protein [Nematostella vectensis]|uniref:ILEI/PANDER domain-containing protein n=1 Tax=Nematostella vectensis TaxID=45351 RepID=A7RKN2_NEMVE|nr:uncharacterized protein LOC5520234 [Nematostella vectensis]EDO47937.1 predicted protein [Nematostella vectensis]|eukprot:XP_001640000.1 predicted protein [Nematostella vectensis]
MVGLALWVFMVMLNFTYGTHYDMYKKINTGGPVCFEAKGDKPAAVTYNGTEEVVFGVALVHVSGKVSCNGKGYSPFGCGGKSFNVFVTDQQDEVILPRKELVRDVTATHVPISVRSEGCDDVGVKPCGIARIWVNGKDYSLHRRGFNFVVVDPKTGRKLDAQSFDTYVKPVDGERAYNYTKSLKGDKIVLVAIQDAAWEQLTKFPMHQELIRLGAKGPIIRGFRTSLALIGYAGSERPQWLSFGQNARYKGPTTVTANIPFKTGKSFWYKVTNRDVTSKSILLADVLNPFLLGPKQQLKVWFGEDLDNQAEDDNAGRTCVDVYAWLA